jgi:uncharacterized membrane protein YbhN (UPF0104 family)
MLLGLSQVAVVRALSTSWHPIEPSVWPVVIASVALATVSGFVIAVMPGGLGVREGVLMATLGPAVGAEMAVIAAIALRLTWVLAEVIAAGALTIFQPRPMKAVSP